MCKVLVEGYAKYFNVHIVVHKSIMADTNLKDQAKAVHPWDDKWAGNYHATITDPQVNATWINELMEANKKIG